MFTFREEILTLRESNTKRRVTLRESNTKPRNTEAFLKPII